MRVFSLEDLHQLVANQCQQACLLAGLCQQRRPGHAPASGLAKKQRLIKVLKSRHHRSTHCYRAMCFWCHIFLCVLSAVPSLEAKETPERFRDHEYFLRKLFDKYGHDGKMTFEGFEHLLENLGLAHITIRDHDLSAHRPQGANVGFVNHHAHHVHVDGVGATAVVDDHHDHHDHRDGRDSSDHMHASEGDRHARVQRDLSSQDHTEAVDSSNRTEAPSVPKVSATTRTAEVSFEKCLTATEILHTVDTSPEASVINLKDFQQLCPALVYQLDEKHCSEPQLNRHIHHHSDGEEETTVDFKVWMYAFLGVLGISVTGLLSVAIVPLMQKVFYQTLIQFLVGLAVGSLTGDALLHLLPHAMSGHHHDHAEEGGDGENYVWHGLAALGGIYLFLIVERFLSIHSNHKHRKHSPRSNNSIQSNPTPKRLQRSSLDDPSKVVGEKLSQHKQGSYGYVDPSGMEALERLTAVPAEELELSPLGEGYMEIMDIRDSELRPKAGMEAQPEKDLLVIVKNGGSKLPTNPRCPPSPLPQDEENNHRHPICHGSGDQRTEQCHTETLVYRQTGEEHTFMLTVADHHHHRHSHAHSHEVPSSIAAMAWMVIIGDGLHNFSDGLAIGAAFASGLSGGLSTTIAVFCHELPHELGDFAVLLKAGMSVKQAVFYNIVSSVLCLLGMAIGISLGNVHSASSWIFAGVGGMFLYIALVDMLPELSVNPNHGNARAVHQLGIQLLGISLGVTTMFVIALYERDLQRLMSS
ncbi:zinc transporter foi isoform X1 [Rhipicephalus microplus]|uniref:zinc transporter foi isoform X1 n=1 Tax=Rhipicephalus microplus TaxID=6941 RepID=UPI003F6ADFEA